MSVTWSVPDWGEKWKKPEVCIRPCGRRNVPHRRDPERFHVEKSCVCQDLERIADELEPRPINHIRGLPVAPGGSKFTPGRVKITTETIAGRQKRPRSPLLARRAAKSV
jgi:hypothetical protein